MRMLFLFLWLLSGCAEGRSAAEPQSQCREQAFDGSHFTVCDAAGREIQLIAAGAKEKPLHSFAEVGRRIDPKRIAFAMNAGMFDEDGRPIGLAAINGVTLHKINLRDGPGNFHMKPNGVFLVNADGKPAIHPSGVMPKFRAPPRLMTQSGPMLVIAGKLHPDFERDGTSRLIRNGVGVTNGGRALFVISEDPVSFGKFARFFRDSLHTPNALFLDGSVSSLWDPANGRQDSHSPLGPIIVVLRPAAVLKSAGSGPGRASRARS